MKVYVLWHVYEQSDDFGEHDEEKLIGIYNGDTFGMRDQVF